MRVRRDAQIEIGAAVVLALVIFVISPGAAIDAIVAGVLLAVVLADLVVRRRREGHAAFPGAKGRSGGGREPAGLRELREFRAQPDLDPPARGRVGRGGEARPVRNRPAPERSSGPRQFSDRPLRERPRGQGPSGERNFADRPLRDRPPRPPRDRRDRPPGRG